MHIWKCQKKPPCAATLNKQKYHLFSFTKSKNKRAGQVYLCVEGGGGGGGTSEKEESVGKGVSG
jgi:hypothetical protein